MRNDVSGDFHYRNWVEIVRLLLSGSTRRFRITELECYEGPKKGFLELLNYLEGSYYGSSLDARVRIAIGIADGAPFNSPDLFRIAVCTGPIPHDGIRHKTRAGKTLLHGVAKAMHNTISFVRHYEYNKSAISAGLQGSIA